MFKATIDDVIFNFLTNSYDELTNVIQADILSIISPMYDGLDVSVRQYIEDHVDSLNDTPNAMKSNKLCVLLQTTGGSVEVVERITRVFRNYYDEVIFIVPNFAYSAGTVLVLSGDVIYMDYFSVLGPIDPQIRNKDGEWLPANGYLNEFENLISTINYKDSQGENPLAELTLLANQFNPEKLGFIKQSNQFSKNLIKEWLPKYKFKNWKYTETTSQLVTEDMKVRRAEEIAEILANVHRWNTHGRGIGLSELTSEEIKLKIENFAEDATMNKAIRIYYDVLADYTFKMGYNGILHGSQGLRRLL